MTDKPRLTKQEQQPLKRQFLSDLRTGSNPLIRLMQRYIALDGGARIHESLRQRSVG